MLSVIVLPVLDCIQKDLKWIFLKGRCELLAVRRLSNIPSCEGKKEVKWDDLFGEYS